MTSHRRIPGRDPVHQSVTGLGGTVDYMDDVSTVVVPPLLNRRSGPKDQGPYPVDEDLGSRSTVSSLPSTPTNPPQGGPDVPSTLSS